MGQELELDFEKYCVVDASPKTVLPSPRHSNLETRKVRKKPKFRNEVSLHQNNEFTEITFNRYRSASCKTNPSIRLQVDEAPRRGSVYQSSMNRIKEKEKNDSRQKIAVSRKNGTPLFSSEIVDSLCNSDEDSNNSVNSVNKENLSTSLHKSLSSRLSIPQSPTKTETDSPKSSTRFSPFRKMFDPFTKSKSFKTPLNSTIQEHEPTSSSSSTSSINTRKITSRKSLLNDFSNTEKDSCTSVPSSSSSSLSPAHLCGTLKMKNKNGMPYFEFSVKNPNDLLVAKTWNMGDGFNWVYTFHMGQNRRTSNVSGRSSKDSKDSSRSQKEFSMIAQMQVSCYLCTNLINSKSFENSMLTEFVLYDLTRPKDTPESTEIDQEKKVNEKVNVSSNPWSVNDLHPDLETAAIVLRFPNGKRESLKGDMRNYENLEIGCDKLTPTRVDVVVPKGNHGLPGGEGCGPAPLLDRWRMGGGCECGGWDMGCPLVVFGSHDMKNDQNGHVEIFLKGGKEKIPSLTMKRGTEGGQYVVDFHAQLSSLQAFSICVAILHGTEASVVVNGGDMNTKILDCDSLRVFIEDEVKHLIEGPKGKLSKNLEEISSTFVVNPPFSPMSRA